jgi:hypothetical protein
VSGTIQLWASVPWDADTSYHIAVARLLREYGILHKFPWTRFSWLNENYADKEFLFHRKYVIEAIVSFLYPLCYVAWHSALTG